MKIRAGIPGVTLGGGSIFFPQGLVATQGAKAMTESFVGPVSMTEIALSA